MTKEEIKNKISEHKECCKKLAEEYRQRYNEDNTDKLALNMFYHNVISFNDFEIILATIEDRNSMMMCFSEPPYLTEETVEVNIKRIEELEKENAELKESGSVICDRLSERIDETVELKNENIGLKNLLTKAKEIIKNLLILKNDHYGNTKMEWRVKVTEQAEQFLKDLEK